MNRTARRWAVLLIVFAAGCGGGGMGSDPTSSTSKSSSMSTTASNCHTSMSDMDMSMPNMSHMMPNCTSSSMLESAARPQEPLAGASRTLTASANGNSYSLTYSVTTNPGTTMFDGQMASSSSIALTMQENGTPVGTETATAYYLTNPYVALGLTGTADGVGFEIIFNSTNPYPTTLSVGASGPLAIGTFYTPGTNVAIGSLSVTYSVEANNASSLLLKVASSATLAGNQVPPVIAYAVDSSGEATLSSIQVTLKGVTLTFS